MATPKEAAPFPMLRPADVSFKSLFYCQKSKRQKSPVRYPCWASQSRCSDCQLTDLNGKGKPKGILLSHLLSFCHIFFITYSFKLVEVPGLPLNL